MGPAVDLIQPPRVDAVQDGGKPGLCCEPKRAPGATTSLAGLCFGHLGSLSKDTSTCLAPGFGPICAPYPSTDPGVFGIVFAVRTDQMTLELAFKDHQKND